MKKEKRAQQIQKLLDEYFPNPTIPLQHSDPFTLLIAVVLSARSTDAMVNRITPALFERAATAEQMAQLSEEEIRFYIKPCGLSPQKSKAIKELSHLIVQKYGGKVPQNFEELEALPGVGHKTASVVMAQAFHVPAFPVDTHIFRSAHRWGLTSAKTVVGVEKDLKKIFPVGSWIKLHLQIILFARTYCPARNHQIGQCPICSSLL